MDTARGFTLIELLIVIGVIGVLASITYAAINVPTQFAKARDAQRKQDLRGIQSALEVFYNDNNRYPNQLVAAEWPGFGNAWSNYMQRIPQDPRSGQNYAYVQTQSGQGYRLYARLERCTSVSQCFDSQACNAGNACVNVGSATCGGACTYGKASSNESP